MFGKKTTASPDIERAVSQGVNYELTIADRARRSERRAWIVAGCAIFMSLILAGGYFLFLPLKEKVPYLVMADPYTGTATVARLVGNFNDRDVTTEEAINKSNVAQFVLARESYDSGLIGQRNWRTTLSMASPAVAPAYIALHSENNPERPFRIYGPSRAVRVRILSIVLIGGGEGRRPSGATVRFQRSVYDKGNGRSEPLDSKIATLEFTYNPDLRLSEEDRLLNPLGFRVANYRVDNDYASGSTPEREFPALLPATANAAATAPTYPAEQAMQIPMFGPPDAGEAGSAAPQAPQPAEQTEANRE
ncbi:type IV secretion system protein [Luteimonas aestuarii]|uniref:Type IV secretion system protein n=1 Tax=Luteimonas aestuarii TaxID=453837 RepID=A0A4R5TRA9_9GAMM|nr:type IV secretion system protein [Luteimonas aestuarii]TDK22667.1 type IV secretion system protein [Luteimonas aestuarii]